MAFTMITNPVAENIEEGVLVPLKTCLEVASRDRIHDVWVASLDCVQNASYLLSLIRSHFPGDGGFDFNHLKRFAKLEQVPECVKLAYKSAQVKSNNYTSQLSEGKNFDHLDSLFGVVEEEEMDSGYRRSITEPQEHPTPASSSPSNCTSSLLVIVSSVKLISIDSLSSILSLNQNSTAPVIFSISVPLLAPTSEEQAKIWSKSHWPTVYKKNNPFGPHPSIVLRAQAEILGETSKWMTLAWTLAKESKESGRGEEIGAVVVERKYGYSSGTVVSVAGDARWLDWAPRNRIAKGNPASHAIMRAISLVATAMQQKKLDKKKSKFVSTSTTISTSRYDLDIMMNEPSKNKDWKASSSTSLTSIFHEQPLSIIERQYYDQNIMDESINNKGYLCQGLEIYCTHEPCVMCSMAMVHSRFNRVIFEKRMFRTGGLTADGLLGHGLFWRKELNWTMLAWQWRMNTATSHEKDHGNQMETLEV